jgi:hypothetical protein
MPVISLAYLAYAVSLHMQPIGVTPVGVIADLVYPHYLCMGAYATRRKRKIPERTSRTGGPLGPPR